MTAALQVGPLSPSASTQSGRLKCAVARESAAVFVSQAARAKKSPNVGKMLYN